MTPAVSRSVSALENLRVEEVMSHGVLSCPLETPLTEVARLMATNRVHCIVGFGDITEDDTRLWGVVSDLDLVGLAATEGLEGRTAGTSAATEAVTVAPDESVRRAAQLMREHGVAHVVVADPHSDRPVGVVSTLDIAAVVGGAPLAERESGGA